MLSLKDFRIIQRIGDADTANIKRPAIMLKKLFKKFGDNEWFFNVFLRWWQIVWISIFVGLIVGLVLFYPIWK